MPTKHKAKSVKPAATDSFTSPESSNVEGASYDPNNGACVVAFRDKKKPEAVTLFYTYRPVLLEDWLALKQAESKGRHMAKVFTRKYKGTLVS